MHMLILGSSGLLGSALQEVCRKQGVKCTPLTREHADIGDADNLKRVIEQFKPSHIVNCAAYTDVDGAEKNPEEAFRTNAEGPHNLGRVASEARVKVVHISTDYVFDGEGNRPYNEEDGPNPRGVYARSKWEGELALLDAFPQACILRTSWLFGLKGKNFISSILNVMLKKSEVRVVTDQRGRPTYAKDLAEALLALACHSGIFHFANSGEASRFELAQNIFQEARALGLPLICQTVNPAQSHEFPTPAPRPPYSVLCTRKIEAVLGKAPRSWQETLKEYLHDAKI